MKKIAKNKRIVDSGESKAVTWIQQFARQIGKVPLRNPQKLKKIKILPIDAPIQNSS